MSSNALTCVGMRIPVARMRSIYRLERSRSGWKSCRRGTTRAAGDVRAHAREGRGALPGQALGAAGDGVALRGAPNFHEVLDDVRRQIALEASSDALEITPLLLLGPPAWARRTLRANWPSCWGTGIGFVHELMTAGWVLSGASSQWKGARAGKVFEALVEGDYANPVMVIDD